MATDGNHSSLNLDDGTNPHGTTQSDVGLGNVDNTSDLDKPISTATQAALDLKYNASNPNGYETPVQLDARDTANRARANHTGTQLASTISDFANAVRTTVLTGLSIVDSVVTAADTVLSSIGKLQGQINNILANLLYAETAVNTAGLIKNTTTFETFLQLNANVPVTGNYKITWTYVWSLNDGAQDFVAEMRENGNLLWEHRQEPKDSAGTGIDLPNTDGGDVNTGTNQRHVLTAHEVVNLSAGVNTIDIQFACAAANDRAAIYRGRISIEKWGVN